MSTRPIVAAVCIPGSTGACYAIYKNSDTPSEVRTLTKFSKDWGGCEFWFVKSTLDYTGWYMEDLYRADELKTKFDTEDRKGTDKIKELIIQLKKGDSVDKNKEIKKHCKEKSGEIIELAWDMKDGKWKVETAWGKNAHRKPTYVYTSERRK